MKAIVFTEYGSPDVLHLKDIPKPEPKEHEILVRVWAAQVNYGDLTARNFANLTGKDFNMPALFFLPARIAFGWKKPKINIPGSELAGEVEAAGSAVTRFRPGDRIFAYVGMAMGANGEYICIAEKGTVALAPENLTYPEAATLPYGAIMASSLLRKVTITPGSKVTGVCSTPRLEYVRALGADKVIDYTREDFTKNGERYDVVFDILGRTSFSQVKASLSPRGVYLLASYKMKAVFQMVWTSLTRSRKKVICAFAEEKTQDLYYVRELAEKGQIKTIIDRCFPLAQTAEAHRYIEAGQRKGAVIITLGEADEQGNGYGSERYHS
jgi:NADPH:quinone reductase-like Zn-dependent oxidoreductase